MRLRLRLLVLLGLLLALLFEQFLQLFQLDVIRVKFQPVGHRLLGRGDVVGNVALRATVKIIVSGRDLRANSLP